MEDDAKNKSSNRKSANSRPPFTAVDWVIAAVSIVLMIYLLANLPAY